MTGLEGPRIVSLDVMPIETRNYYVGAELTSVMWGNLDSSCMSYICVVCVFNSFITYRNLESELREIHSLNIYLFLNIIVIASAMISLANTRAKNILIIEIYISLIRLYARTE